MAAASCVKHLGHMRSGFGADRTADLRAANLVEDAQLEAEPEHVAEDHVVERERLVPDGLARAPHRARADLPEANPRQHVRIRPDEVALLQTRRTAQKNVERPLLPHALRHDGQR
eukprot:5667843-Pleurochrysis_carterae.AAC.3